MIPNPSVSNYLATQKRIYEDTPAEPWNGLTWYQPELLKTIDYYKNSRFLDGDYDEDGQALHFQNIVNVAAETAITFQDIDEIDLQMIAVDAPRIKSRLLNKENQKFMSEIRMGTVLNDMTETRVDYGGVWVRKRMRDGKLSLEIPHPKDIVCNPRDWERDAITQRSVISPSGLRDKVGIWDNAEEALEMYHDERKIHDLSPDIVVHETFGYLPNSFGNDKEDVADGYENRVAISISFESMEWQDKEDNAVEGWAKTTQHYTVFSDSIKEIPLKYVPYKKVAGRTLGRGVIEAGVHAQVSVNRSIYEQQKSMSIAGKVIMQSASDELDADSIADLPNGSILRHESNKPITNLNVTPSALPVWDSMINRFQSEFESETSVNPFSTGSNVPSRIAFNTAEMMQQVSTKSFNKRKQEMDLFIREIYQDWLIPYFIDNLTKSHTLEAEYSKEELEELDKEIAIWAVRNDVEEYKQRNGGVAPSFNQVGRAFDKVMRGLAKQGDRRKVKIPDGFFKGINAQVKLNITGENVNKETMMSSFSNLLQVLMQNPMALQNETISGVLNEMMEYAGMSTVRLNRPSAQQAQAPAVSGSGSGAAVEAMMNQGGQQAR